MNALTVASLANGANRAVTLVAGGALNLGGTAIDTGTANLALQSGALLTTTASLGGANVTLQGDGGIPWGPGVTAGTAERRGGTECASPSSSRVMPSH